MRRGKWGPGIAPLVIEKKSVRFVRHLAVGTVVMAAAASARMASAQVSFTLTSYASTVSAGGETFFYGTITNNGTTLLYLNGLDIEQLSGTTPSSGVFSTDDAPFYNNAPATLAASGGTFTGQLFGIDASNSLTINSKFNGAVSVLGGSTSSSDAVLSGPLAFMVTAAGATPEPAAVTLVLVGMMASGSVIRRRHNAFLRD